VYATIPREQSRQGKHGGGRSAKAGKEHHLRSSGALTRRAERMETDRSRLVFDRRAQALEFAALTHDRRSYRNRKYPIVATIDGCAAPAGQSVAGKVAGKRRRTRPLPPLGGRSQSGSRSAEPTPARTAVLVGAVLLTKHLVNKLQARRSPSSRANEPKPYRPPPRDLAVPEERKPLGFFARVARFFREWGLACTVSSLMLPGSIAIATVLLFLTRHRALGKHANWSTELNRTNARVCFFGAVVGLAFCVLLAAAACRRFTRAESACPEPYDELRERFDDLGARLAVVFGCASEPASDQSPAKQIWREAACREASQHLAYLEHDFSQPTPIGLRWLLATGYLDAWRRLHAVEQSLLVLEPDPRILSESLHDELRLDGSTIPQSTALLKRLRAAVLSIDPLAADYLIEAPAAPKQGTKVGARAVISQVRGAISEFRDSRREGLVRARNRLFGTVIFVGTTGCVLLFIAILGGAGKRAVEAAAAFYLVGALVGLVKQLQSAATGGSAAESDYGLGVVRLISTPLFSGLAAIGGVVLFKLAQGQGSVKATSFSMKTTFDLRSNPYGLVAAAVFGLTPALLFAGLRQRVEQYRTDLSKSSSPAGGQ
jgi:uncharacterized membrane protein YjfL (UPF0719 family)